MSIIALKSIITIILILTFILLVFLIYLPNNKNYFDYHACLPFLDNEKLNQTKKINNKVKNKNKNM